VSSALQNRLVGTIILVAIAVIFLPDLLDGKKQSNRDLFVELPKKPSMSAVQAPDALDTDKVKEAATRQVEVISEQALDDPISTSETTDTEQNQTNDVQVEDEYAPSVATEKQSSGQQAPSNLGQQTVVEQDTDKLLSSAGWVVQLGRFRHKKNVQELLNLLEKAGYRAFSRPVKTNSGTLTKVFVGPDLEKRNLEEALSHLKELTKLQGRVTPFTVQ